jgi:hypothetical protein
MRICILLLGLLPVVVSSAGCRPEGPEVVPVSGVLTRQGKPLPNMQVWFKPAEGRPSWGASDEAGRFTLNYARGQDGARVGKHKVWVKYDPRPLDAAEEMAIQSGRKKGPSQPSDLQAILEKYGTEGGSPIEIVVEEPIEDLEIELE